VEGFALIRVDDPDHAWGQLLELVKPPAIEIPAGVHERAFVAENARLGKGVAVMAHATVMDGATIGDGTVIYPYVYIGHGTTVGRGCLIYPAVMIRERVELGDRVVVQPGAVIGSDGFGFSEKNGRHVKQEQFGTVVIEDDVEIGANVTVDRARFHETRICRGTKIDNLVQIAHNVSVGCDSVIVSQTGISGSCRIGNRVKIGGQVGIVGHLTIGDDAAVAAGSGVVKNLEGKKVYFGTPAQERIEAYRQVAAVRRLPGLLKTIKQLEERIARLEAQSGND
jgi:UDP-3-O-[3-hydroxymyristoyl] glucosamine N-acyltransferase